jgi:hypothetical protein
MNNFTHFLYCPFTGLGLYNGFRGNQWLKNRILIFKQFVVPSLLAQINKNFVLWVSWRPQERINSQVHELKLYLDAIGIKNIFTYGGICFWDDKYKDEVARERLIMSLHNSINDLILDLQGDWILMTIQPSDDIYRKEMVDEIQKTFIVNQDAQAIGYSKGYIINYQTKEVAEYNPLTNPPFFTIKFPKPVFIDPLKHLEYTGPYKSHEYIGNHLKYYITDERGFMVGCHSDNISTFFNHPFKGKIIESQEEDKVLDSFGILDASVLKVKVNIRKKILNKLSYKIRRKLRYWFGELFYNKLHRIWE